MKTILNWAVAAVFAGALGACAGADDDVDFDATDVTAQESPGEPEPQPTTEREIAPTRDWSSCWGGGLQGIECGRDEGLTEDDASSVDDWQNEVQALPSGR